MNKTIIKIKLLALSFIVSTNILAQKKLTKVEQTIKVNKDARIDLNTSYTNIIFDTWNKDVVEIEAYIEGEDLSTEELNEALKSWNVDIDGTSNSISITTQNNKHKVHVWNLENDNEHDEDDLATIILKELKHELADLPEIIMESLHFDGEILVLPEIPELPELPELPKNRGEIHFDYEAYKKDGDKYLKEYSQKFESTFGEDYAKKMEKWSENFGKEWAKKYEKQMEAWGERHERQMEVQLARQKAYEKRIEAHAIKNEERQAHIEKMHEKGKALADERRIKIKNMVKHDAKSKIKKTIRIKVPKSAKLKVNVRHGELEFASNVDNLKADLSHTKFTAQSVNGSSTSVSASYSPVHVSHWNLGELNLKYVKEAELNNVKNMVLTSSSSNVTIDNLLGNSIIDSNIGDIKILKIDDAFTNLNVIVQNSDAFIALPKTDCNLQYKGTHSNLSHPKNTSNKQVSSYSKNKSIINKSIIVNAKYSTIVMK